MLGLISLSLHKYNQILLLSILMSDPFPVISRNQSVWTSTFVPFCPWQRYQNIWGSYRTLLHIASVFLLEVFNLRNELAWVLMREFISGFMQWHLLLCFCSQGSTSASGQDFLCRHWDGHTLERLHGGGCGGWGESCQRGRAQDHGLEVHKSLINSSKIPEILAVSPYKPYSPSIDLGNHHNHSFKEKEKLNQTK